MQTKEAAKQAEASGAAVRASVYLTLQVAAMDLDGFFFEHPDLRAKFYGTVSGPGAQEDLQRGEAAAEMVIDLFDMMTVHEMHIPDAAAEGWREYIRYMMTNSDALRKFWHRNKGWYPALRPLVDAAAPEQPVAPTPRGATEAPSPASLVD